MPRAELVESKQAVPLPAEFSAVAACTRTVLDHRRQRQWCQQAEQSLQGTAEREIRLCLDKKSQCTWAGDRFGCGAGACVKRRPCGSPSDPHSLCRRPSTAGKAAQETPSGLDWSMG